MEDFVTINLDSNSCDICNQDTGEELVKCVLNDRCLRENTASTAISETEPYKQAHRECLLKWETVIKSTLKPRCPSPKRSWKDKIKDLLNRNTEETGLFDTWVPVDKARNDEGCFDELEDDVRVRTSRTNQAVCQNLERRQKNQFLVNEAYRVERVNEELDGCEERARKLRVRSIDLEEDGTSILSSQSELQLHHMCDRGNSDNQVLKTSWTTEKLMQLEMEKVKDILRIYKEKIREVSADLITVLQERDSLSQQGDTLRVTVGQLVQLQQKQKIKTLRVDLEQQTSKDEIAPKIAYM